MLATLVKFGAPANILMDGKPHVGTDKLVLILRAFRQHMQTLGVVFLAPLPLFHIWVILELPLNSMGRFVRRWCPTISHWLFFIQN